MTTQRLFSLAPMMVLTACGAPQAQPPRAAPAPTAAATPAADVASPAADPTPDAPLTDPAKAQALVDEGRGIQRERGEGGADDAIAAYTQALAADPKCGAALWELGWSYQVKGQLDLAVEAWDRLRTLDPSYPELSTHYPVLTMRRDQAKALAALPDPGTLPPREETPREGPKVVIRSVGDVNLGRGWPPDRAVLPDNDARELFGPFGDELRKADITDGNLETALADSGDSHKCGPKSTKCFAFRVPTSFVNGLKEAGFDVMGIANNHAGDFGMEGRLTTKKALDGVGIKYSGTLGDIATVETNSLKVGFIAFSTGNDVYSVLDIPTAKKVVAETKRTHDLVIVSFHAGAEGADAGHVPKTSEKFLGENRGDVYAFSHAVIDAGADLAIGHGPHRVRGVEVYKGRFIAYSLGNFCTYKTFGLTGSLGITGILEVTLAANGVALEAELIPGVIEQPGVPKPDPARQAVKIIRDLSKQDFGSEVLGTDGRWTRTKPVAAR